MAEGVETVFVPIWERCHDNWRLAAYTVSLAPFEWSKAIREGATPTVWGKRY
jgi:hypothetical protein